MEPLEFFFLVFGPFLLFGYALFRLYFGNRFTVKPNNIERVVVQNTATGQLKVLGPGTHFLGPGWKELSRVQLNREPFTIASEEARSSDGIRMDVDLRFDLVSGRPFHPRTGQIGIYTPPTPPATEKFEPLDPDDRQAVTDVMVISAVTAINYADREKRAREVIKGAIDRVVGQYTGEQLTVPGEVPPFSVPPSVPPLVTPGNVKNTAELFQQLAQYINEEANLSLLNVGINIVDMRITNLGYKDPKTQEALESKKRLEKYRKAAREVPGVTEREGLALAADPGQYGTVVLGEAGRDAADSIGDGLKNFGRGGQRRRRRGP